MEIETRHLRLVKGVADEGSITRAASVLGRDGTQITHGVTENTANLNYTGDAGGLNESTSDIFGTMVEFFANNASDTPTS